MKINLAITSLTTGPTLKRMITVNTNFDSDDDRDDDNEYISPTHINDDTSDEKELI